MKPPPRCLPCANTPRQTVLGLALAASLVASFQARGQFAPGTALRFDGAQRSVQVPHNVVLNSYPLTVSAWIKTSSTSSVVGAIVSKYAAGSSIGWSVIAANGHVYAWYFIDGSRYVGPGALGMDGGVVADGQWHHIALVVDATGGTLYVDSQPRVQNAWVGAAGATTTTTQPLQIGRYSAQANSFIGDLDEVNVWSKALSAPEVYDLRRRGPTGGEGNLVASWRADETAGTQLTDSSPNARTGMLTNSPAWVTSTAPITHGAGGDVLGYLNSAAVARRIIVTSVPGQETFRVNVSASVRRYDDTATTIGAPSTLLALSGKLFAGTLETRLTAVSNDPVAVATSAVNAPRLDTTLVVAAGTGYLPARPNFTFGGSPGFDVQVSNTTGDALIVNGSSPVLADTPLGPLAPGSALSFDGAARSVQVAHNAAFNSYPLTVSAWIRTSTVDESVRGIVSKYADGSSNGWAMFLSGGRVYAWYTLSAIPIRQVFTPPWGLQSQFVADGQWHHVAMAIDASGGTLYVDAVTHAHGVRTEPQNITLTTSGLTAGELAVGLPAGFGYSASRNDRLLSDEVTMTNVPLNGALAVTAATLSWTPPICWPACSLASKHPLTSRVGSHFPPPSPSRRPDSSRRWSPPTCPPPASTGCA